MSQVTPDAFIKQVTPDAFIKKWLNMPRITWTYQCNQLILFEYSFLIALILLTLILQTLLKMQH